MNQESGCLGGSFFSLARVVEKKCIYKVLSRVPLLLQFYVGSNRITLNIWQEMMSCEDYLLGFYGTGRELRTCKLLHYLLMGS